MPGEDGSPGITYEGGEGDSLKNPVIIRGAGFDVLGTEAIFNWLTVVFGQMDRDWSLIVQSHLRQGERDFDAHGIQLHDGA